MTSCKSAICGNSQVHAARCLALCGLQSCKCFCPCRPAPQHRAHALAGQGACLFLVLFYAPATLHADTSLMRTLVVEPCPPSTR